MPYQSGKNVVAAFKEQVALGTRATGAAGRGIRSRSAGGLNLTAAAIRSGEVRRDGMTTLGRLGSQFAAAEYESELSVRTLDEIFEAIQRSSYVAAFDLDETDLTSITTTANTIVAAGGDLVALGLRVGMVIRLTNHSTAANNGKWLRVVGLDNATRTITVPAGSLTLDAVADMAFTLTVARHVMAALVPEERYFTVEEHMQDINVSKIGEDMKLAGMTISVTPDNMIAVRFRFAGRDVASESGVGPILTDPVFTETQPLVLLDGYLRVNGSDRVDVTGFEISIDLGGEGVAVTGSRLSPDVFLKNAEGGGSLSLVMNDLAEFESFKAEDTIELWIYAAENEVNPSDFVSIYIGRAAYRGDTSPFGNDNAVIESLPFEFGVDTRGEDLGYAKTMMLISTSAAA